MLETKQGDGTYVTQLDPSSLLRPLEFWAGLQEATQSVDLLGVRRVLETDPPGLAAVRLTDEDLDELELILSEIDIGLASGELGPGIHRRGCGISSPDRSRQRQRRPRRSDRQPHDQDAPRPLWRAITESDSLGAAHAEHRAILAALRTRDAERARIRMAAHLLGVEVFAAEHPVAGDPGAEPLSE